VNYFGHLISKLIRKELVRKFGSREFLALVGKSKTEEFSAVLATVLRTFCLDIDTQRY